MEDRILVFEYFTASGETDKSIISEAEALIISLLDDLKDFDVDLIINKSFEYVAESYDNVNPIVIEENIIDYLLKNAKLFNKAIFIAAENNNNLYRITKILEDNKVFIYNSNSKAAFNTSDKYEMYRLLEGIVKQPETSKVLIDSNGDWKKEIKKSYEHRKIIMKPVNGVDCEDILIIDDFNDVENVFPINSNVLIQEFIPGEDVSVSLIVNNKKAIPISLNKQFISIKDNNASYLGGELPYDSKYKNKAMEVAISVCEYLDGLKGFVGVDLRVTPNGEAYLLEVNSRFTTPYVGIQKIADRDIAEDIIRIIDNDLDIKEEEINLSGHVKFKKVKENLVIEEFK